MLGRFKARAQIWYGYRGERAGELALKAGHYSPRYKQLESILKTNQDKIVKDSLDSLNYGEPSGYVRGSDFYKGC